MKGLNQLWLVATLAISSLSTTTVLAESPDTKQATFDRSVNIFGLQLGQSITEVKKTLIERFNIKEEQFEESQNYSPKIDGLEVDSLTVNTIEAPLTLSNGSESTSIKIKNIEVYFTLKLPTSDIPTTASKFILFTFENTHENQSILKQHSVEMLGEPVLNNSEGYQWCNELNSDMQSCKTICEVDNKNDYCPPSIVIALAETTPTIYSFAIVDWSMDQNAQKALKNLE